MIVFIDQIKILPFRIKGMVNGKQARKNPTQLLNHSQFEVG